MDLKKLIVVGLSLTFTLFVPFAILFGIILFGLAGFFSLIGVTYDSLWALMIFIIACFVMSLLFEIIEVVILEKIKQTRISNYEKLLWRFVISGMFTWIVIYIVSGLMKSIDLTISAQILTALLIVGIDIALDYTPKKNAKRRGH